MPVGDTGHFAVDLAVCSSCLVPESPTAHAAMSQLYLLSWYLTPYTPMPGLLMTHSFEACAEL